MPSAFGDAAGSYRFKLAPCNPAIRSWLGASMIHIIRPPSPLPKTHIHVKCGDLTFPYTLPTEREQKRLWRDYGPPPTVESDTA
jgi:hypothetical protein